MRTLSLYFLSLMILCMGCAQVSGSDDFTFGKDSSSGNISEGTPTATVSFCNGITSDTGDVSMVLKIGDTSEFNVFKAQTNCCTQCKVVPAGASVNIELYYENYLLFTTETYIVEGSEYIYGAQVDAAEEPMVAYLDLASEGGTCDEMILEGYDRCEDTATVTDLPGNESNDNTDPYDTDPNDTDPSVGAQCGGYTTFDACFQDVCEDELLTCTTNPDCISISSCVTEYDCETDACLEMCYDLYPAGTNDFYNMINCGSISCGDCPDMLK